MTDQPCFTIALVPEKGLGVLATRSIQAGELILSEAPLFKQTRDRTQQSIADDLATKSAEEKRLYLQLHNCHQKRHGPILGIFETNALPCGDNNSLSGQQATSAGVFLTAARFNSSCIPNVNNQWSEKKQVVEIRALREIATGEELCICYCSLLENRELRRQELKAKFRFDCHCPACSLTGDALTASDARRLRLKALFHESAVYTLWPAEGVKQLKIALLFLKEEGIFLYRDIFSYDAFHFCAAASDRAHAIAWAKQTAEALRIANGTESEDMEMLMKAIRDLKSHPSWGTGTRVTLEGPDE